MDRPTKRQDLQHLRTGYALLKEALDEFQQIYRKDSVMAKTVRTLGAIEDTLYQMITEDRRAM